MHPQLSEAIKYWNHMAPIIKYPKNNRDYEELVYQLDELLDIVGSNEKHRLIGLVDAMSSLISSCETYYFLQPLKIKGIKALKYLMDAHHLAQKDLSEILNGKRLLNIRQIKLLAKRFEVNPSTFIDE